MNTSELETPLGEGVRMMCCDTDYATVAETLNHVCPVKPNRTCEQCGTQGRHIPRQGIPRVTNRLMARPNRHDDGLRDTCDPCWRTARSTEL